MIPEKLVEEIADYLQACYAMGQHDYKLGIGYGETPRKWDRDRAKKIIALTLSAVRDGRLDEELGVMGRQPWYREKLTDEAAEMWLYWLSLMMAGGAKAFIALREERENG